MLIRQLGMLTLERQLHFARPTAHNEIYNGQNKWDKDREYYRAFDVDESFFAQTDYFKSKHGRGLISNMFSKRAILELQHLIRERVRSISVFALSVSLDLLVLLDGSVLCRAQGTARCR